MSPDREKPSARAERLLIERFLDGTYPTESDLPGERDLSKDLGVARPALREALQRLARDGWLEIQQGKPTRVNHFMRDGNLNVLISLLQTDISLLPDFVPNLLEMWGLIAPTYTRLAIHNDAENAIYSLLDGFRGLADRARPYARAQWRLHRLLIDLCGNPVYGLVLNSFMEFYLRLATAYFADPEMRREAGVFWEKLKAAALTADADTAARAMQAQMISIRRMWSTEAVIQALAQEVQEEEDD